MHAALEEKHESQKKVYGIRGRSLVVSKNLWKTPAALLSSPFKKHMGACSPVVSAIAKQS